MGGGSLETRSVGRQRLWPVLRGVLGVVAAGATLASAPLAAEAPGDPLPDSEIEAVIERYCRGKAGSSLEAYRGRPGDRYEMVGPLYLTSAGKKEVYGVVLPPFLRLYHYARSRKCGKATVEQARELAGMETWVVLWRLEHPASPFDARTDSDHRLLTPTQVRWRVEGTWRQPTWSRSRDKWVRSWFARDWNDGRSLVVAFESLQRDGTLHADYDIEEDGRSYLTDSALFSLSLFSERWWDVAHGKEHP